MSRVVIYGNEDGEQMNRITGETGRFNPKALEKELVDLATKMVTEAPRCRSRGARMHGIPPLRPRHPECHSSQVCGTS